MARKPLIEPGSMLPDTDTMTRILERDRAKSGRTPPQSTPDEEPLQDEAANNISSNITTHIDSKTEKNEYAHIRSKVDGHTATQQTHKPVSKTSMKEMVRKRAQELAATRPMPITLRLPEGLNDWLDDYAHTHRKEGIKKQDLIARAVQLLVIELEGSVSEEGGAK